MKTNYLHINFVTAQNFLSIAEPVTLDFNKHWGTILLHGYNNNINISEASDDKIKNGVGKSVLCQDAVLFGLFGKTGKNLKKGSIPNWSTPKNCKVTVDFHINSDHYVVESGVNPTFCNLYRNDEDITKSTVKLTYEYISDQVLGTSFLILKNTHFLNITNSSNVFELNKAEKREFIEKIFNVSIFGDIWQAVKDDGNKKKKDLNEDENKLKQLNETIEQFQEKKKNYEEEKKKKKQNIEKQIETIKKDRKELETDVSAYDGLLKEMKEKYEQLEKECEQFKDKANRLLNEKRAKVNENKTIQELLDTYTDIVDVICENCYNKVDNLLDFEKNRKGLENNKEKIEKIEKAEKKLSGNQNEKKSELSSLKSDLDKLQKKRDIVNRNSEKVQFYNKELDRLQNELEKIDNEKSEFDELVKKYQSNVEQVKKRIDSVKDDLKYINFLVYFFSEEAIKKYLITLFIGTINDMMRGYLRELGSEYTVSVDAEFNFTFYTLNGEAEFENFSNGERRRIVVSTLFAIKDILQMRGTLQCNVASFDEILDASIDNYAFSKMIDIINRESNKVRFITTQRKTNEEQFDGIIELSKYGNQTSIAYDSQLEENKS